MSGITLCRPPANRFEHATPGNEVLHLALALRRDQHLALLQLGLRQVHAVCDEHGDFATTGLFDGWIDETE